MLPASRSVQVGTVATIFGTAPTVTGPAAPAPSVTTSIAANATPTFSIFVAGSGTVAFDPANNRAFVRFKDAGGATRGSTSVAVRAQ